MKKLGLLISAMMLVGVLVVACDNDDNENECNKAAAVMATTVDSYCAGREGECWACDCYNQDMMAVETGAASPITYECQTVAKVCDATNLSTAETCLADEAQCATDAETHMTDYCGVTAK
jgi:hypothetical protein